MKQLEVLLQTYMTSCDKILHLLILLSFNLVGMNQHPPSTSSRCFNCAEKGHISKQCPKPQSTMCYNCQEKGHISQKCPVGKYCHSCGDPNHLISVCPIRGPVCFKCGTKGHFARNCSPGERSNQPPPSPVAYSNFLSLLSSLDEPSSMRCCLSCVTCSHDSQHCCKQIGGF